MPDRRDRPPALAAMAAILRPGLRLVTRRTWLGVEHLPREGGFVAVANHVSNADPLVVGDFLDANGAPPRFLTKASLFELPVLGPVITAAGQIPVHRRSARAAESLAAAAAALAAGECVVVFPEGTLTRDRQGWPMTARTGAARLALSTRVPIVPVAHWGAQELQPPFTPRFRPVPPKHVTVLAGEPVDLDDLYDRPADRDVLVEATARIMARITEQLVTVRGGVPPQRPYDTRVDGDPRARFDAARAARQQRRRERRARRRELAGTLTRPFAGAGRPRA